MLQSYYNCSAASFFAVASKHLIFIYKLLLFPDLSGFLLGLLSVVWSCVIHLKSGCLVGWCLVNHLCIQLFPFSNVQYLIKLFHKLRSEIKWNKLIHKWKRAFSFSYQHHKNTFWNEITIIMWLIKFQVMSDGVCACVCVYEGICLFPHWMGFSPCS